MIEISDDLKNTFKKNIRPKMDVRISVRGFNKNNELKTYAWNGENLKSMTYKRGVDPLGNELPYMELRWEEFYNGTLNEKSQPTIYDDVATQMEVTLWFTQQTGFFATWKSLYQNYTWKQLYAAGYEWNLLPNSDVIPTPKLYLAEPPRIENNKIIWVARDIMWFLTNKVYFWEATANLKNVMLLNLVKARATLWNNQLMRDAIQKSIKNIESLSDFDEFAFGLLSEDEAKNNLKNCASLFNYYFDFDLTGALVGKKITQKEVDFEIPADILYKYPAVTYLNDIYEYSWIQNTATKSAETFVATKTKDLEFNNLLIYRFDFEQFGTIYNDINSNLNYALSTEQTDKNVNKINRTKYEHKIIDENVVNGDAITENNPFCDWNADSPQANTRRSYLSQFANSNLVVLDAELLSLPMLEPCDRILIDTNLVDKSGKTINKDCVLINYEINYNGAFKEFMKLQEVKGD